MFEPISSFVVSFVVFLSTVVSVFSFAFSLTENPLQKDLSLALWSNDELSALIDELNPDTECLSREISEMDIFESEWEQNEATFTILLCNVYAYQSDSVLVRSTISDSSEITRELLMFPVGVNQDPMLLEERSATMFLFHEGYGELSSYAKYRGVADCGFSARYRWDESSQQIELLWWREKIECDGTGFEEPWPLIYEQE